MKTQNRELIASYPDNSGTPQLNEHIAHKTTHTRCKVSCPGCMLHIAITHVVRVKHWKSGKSHEFCKTVPFQFNNHIRLWCAVSRANKKPWKDCVITTTHGTALHVSSPPPRSWAAGHPLQTPLLTSCSMSAEAMALLTCFLLVSCTIPPRRNSSRTK